MIRPSRSGRVRSLLSRSVLRRTDSFTQASSSQSPGTAGGGDEGNRTLDPLLAGQVLSQLSYTPIEGIASTVSMIHVTFVTQITDN